MAESQGSPNEIHGRGVSLVIISVIFFFVATCVVATRLIARRAARQLGKDDFVISLAYVFAFAMSICNLVSVAHGYGKSAKTLSRGNLMQAMKAFWAMQILYKFTINLTKISICFLSLRISRNATWPLWGNFRHLCYAAMTYVFGFMISAIIVTIWQCKPIRRYWDPTVDGTCIDRRAFWYAGATLNIIGDFIILLLPVPMVWHLNIPRRQKYILAFMWGLGGFVCITSILRMTTLNASAKSMDQTRSTLVASMWTTIEANTGLVCACLPVLRGLAKKLFPRLFSRISGEDDSISTQRLRKDRFTTPKRSSVPAYDRWGQPVRTKAQHTVAATNLSDDTTVFGGSPPKYDSDKTSSDDIVGMDSKDVPMGQIHKKTDFKIDSDHDDGWYPVNHSRTESSLIKPQPSFS